MGVIGTVVTALGTVASGIASYRATQAQAEATRAAAEQQSQALYNNAAQARNEAEAVSRQGMEEESRLRDNVRKVAAAQRAAYGASNLSLASGTPLSVGVDTAEQGEMDASLLRENYARKRLGLENEAAQYGWKAKETKRLGAFQADALSSAATGQLAGSLLSAAGTVASKWSTLAGSSGGSGGWSTRSMKNAVESSWK